MRPRSNGLARSSIYWSVLLVAVVLTLSVLLVLWSTPPVQAQDESTVDDTGSEPKLEEDVQEAGEETGA